VQRRYPVDQYGHRVPGSQWSDTRALYHDADSDGEHGTEQSLHEAAANFLCVLPIGQHPSEHGYTTTVVDGPSPCGT
jgi:hypothetical protein